MEWKIIVILSAVGIIMGFLSVNGLTQKTEPWLWLLFGLAAALVVSKNTTRDTFLQGFLIGLLWGSLNGVIQSIFFDGYLRHNPQLGPEFQKITLLRPKYFVLLTGPIVGAITGILLGGCSLLLKKIW